MVHFNIKEGFVGQKLKKKKLEQGGPGNWKKLK